MNLREWYSNSSELMSAIKLDDRGQTNTTKVLGLIWNISSDTLSCTSFSAQHERVDTKRLVLKHLAKIFDPCGFFSPVTVSAKLLIQKLWKAKFDWDTVLPDDVLTSWQVIYKSLQQITRHVLPRYIGVSNDEDDVCRQLHCFCDASTKAYAAVVYLLVITPTSSTSNIIFAKSRVGPTKPLTVPRMELMAMLIGTRLLSFVSSQLRISISQKFLWSDSQCVLHWLTKANVETRFVKNRVSEIISYRDLNFRYVPTAENPADLSTRGCTTEQLINNSLWWKGPPWLLEPDKNWPSFVIQQPAAVDEQLQRETTLVDNTQIEQHVLLPIENYSSLQRLIRVTAWILRFVNNCRTKKYCSTVLSAAEVKIAQNYWELSTQRKCFAHIIDDIQEQKKHQLTKQLDLFLDDQNFIRCGGRLANASIENDAINPKLLPKDNQYTSLFIEYFHKKLMHAGVTHTLTILRNEYWLVHGRNQVKKVLKNCRVCRIMFGGPYKYPDAPQLPSCRVECQRPFSSVGIDYMGPLFVKCDITQEQKKVWICLFTCALVRAIHLEVIESLTTSDFLLGFRRFIAQHGKPRLIISDNAKQFVSFDKLLRRLWREITNSDDVQNFCGSERIQWKFITEFAPWMGGFYERMIAIVKKALKCSLNRRFVTLKELQTLACEVVTIVNSRPLVFDDSPQAISPITPAHFLGGPHTEIPLKQNLDKDYEQQQQCSNADTLLCYWKKQQKILDNFWKMFSNQYLVCLRSQKVRFKNRNCSVMKPSVNSVVVVKDINLPRCRWKIGRITSVIVSNDGACRSVLIKLSNNTHIRRPISLVYPLETCYQNEPMNDRGDEGNTANNQCRTQRLAAITARRKIRTSLQDTITE